MGSKPSTSSISKQSGVKSLLPTKKSDLGGPGGTREAIERRGGVEIRERLLSGNKRRASYDVRHQRHDLDRAAVSRMTDAQVATLAKIPTLMVFGDHFGDVRAGS